MTYRKFGFFFICVVLMYGMLGAGVQSGAQETGKITDIAVQEIDSTTEISIESSAPFSYTVYKPADPYRFIVEMQDIAQGAFTRNMMIDRAGVTEIIPSVAEGEQAGVKLEIILSVPADIKPVQKDNTLVLSFYNPESGEDVASGKTGEDADISDAKHIEDIELARSNGKVAIIIRGDGKLYPSSFQPADTKVIVDIPGVVTKVESLRMYDPPVMGIRVGQQPDKTRIVVDLAPATQYDLTSGAKEIVLTFAAPQVRETKVAEAVSAAPSTEPRGTVLPEAAYFKTKKYFGEIISLDIQDAPLSKIFGIIAEISGYNIILSPQVQDQRVFIKLDNVPWDQALDVILRNYGLSKSVEGTIVRIAPTSVIAQEEELIARAKEAKMKAGDLETRMYPVDFAELGTLKDLIEEIMEEGAGGGGASDRGSVSIDARTNTLIITDVAQMHDEYEKVIRELDSPTRQVSIEAKIVEVARNFTQELGIQWGLLLQPTPQTQIGSFQSEAGFFHDTPFLVNLPAAAGAGAGGTIAFGYIAADTLRSLDIQLSAMEMSGNGKIISNPKIITLDNEEATISQGKQIPYQTVSAEGTQTQFVNASLELNVTPHITPHGTIVMDISTKKNEADFSNTVQGVPSIDTNEAESQVLVNDGDTLVMGGILKSNLANSQSYVPLLGRLPILGRLFRTERDTDNTSELLIFVTPRVIK